jgi:hypothetical protein
VIGAIGVGINESDTSLRFIKAGDFDCMLLAAATRCSSRARSTPSCRNAPGAASR